MGPRWSVGEGGIGWALQSNVEVRPVLGLTEAHAIAAGLSNNLALHHDGTVSIWSNRRDSPIGDGIVAPARTVPGLADVMAIAAGRHFQLALKSDGTVMAWGDNYWGQLGDGTTLDRDHPLPIPGLEGVVAIAAGEEFAIALVDDGTLMTWGHGRYGQLGTGSAGWDHVSLTPQAVLGLDDVVAVAAGPDHVLAIRQDGSLVAWGSNHEGELGHGTTDLTHSTTPAAVVGIDRVVAIAAGGYTGPGGWWSHSVALREDGTLWAWGSNLGAELGAGPGPSTATPTRVRLPPM
jgi:alpha-tubulin suppressor-like RCC1 family protein